MSQYTGSPGVDITIRDLSAYRTPSGFTAAGIVGGARRGPLSRTVITTQQQLVETYGEPTPEDFGLQAAMALLTYTDTVVYQRIYNHGTNSFTDEVAGFRFSAIESGPSLNGYKLICVEDTAEDTYTLHLEDAKGITVEDYETVNFDPQSPQFIQSVLSVRSVLITSDYTATELEAKPFTIEFDGGEFGAQKAVGKGTAGNSDAPAEESLFFESKNYDSTINGCKVVISVPDRDGFFTYQLLGVQGQVLEAFEFMAVDSSDPRNFTDFMASHSQFFQVRVGSKYYEKLTAPDVIGIAGGTDGIRDLSVSDVIGTGSEGLQSFKDPEQSDIDLLLAPGWFDKRVIAEGNRVCHPDLGGRGDCLFLVDPPFGLSPQQTNDWANADGIFTGEYRLDSAYLALYSGWGLVNDLVTGSSLWVPPSGDIGAMMCESDRMSFPWRAPAGENRGVLPRYRRVEYSPSKPERDLIQGSRNVVNPIVDTMGRGFIVMGQKTTQRRPTALDRVNVVRLICEIRKIVSEISRRFLFEANDQITWHSWRTQIGVELSKIQTARGLYDYRVVMDSSTVTPLEIDNNRMPGKIFLWPTKAAERISVTFVVTSTGVSFEEIAAAV